MPGIDWIPVVSHLKSAVQAVTGDTEGAKRTLVNFHRECPGVAQATSLLQLVDGDVEGAWETQKICLGTVNNVANGVPVVGHAKGAIHHLVGDHEGGNRALNAATRSTVVVASGAAAGLATGGVGAISAGIAAGASYDLVATTVTGEDQGYVAAVRNVSENPSAGSIIDAVALPVGDGLAGYSGGQMANKVKLSIKEANNKAKIQHLEAVRQIKNDKLQTMMDTKSGTTGEAMQLGAEINRLTSDINTLERGTPHFWTDVKAENVAANEASASTSTSATVGMPVGCADKNTQDEERPTMIIPENISTAWDQQQFVVNKNDALYHESYVDATITENNRATKKANMEKLDKQQAQKHIGEAYTSAKFNTFTELESLLERINREPNRDPDSNPKWKKDVANLIKWYWLYLNMPKEFPYTVVVQLNSMIQGYYHSFIRHMNEWNEVISFDETLITRLDPLIDEIRGYASATDYTSGNEARAAFLAARQELTRDEYNDLQTALAEIQLSMHSFMQENMTYNNYVGRTVTAGGNEQLFFKVKTRSGERRIMVVCLSEERFKPETENGRPLRILVTVFFRRWKDFNIKHVLETKEEMENKKKK